MDFTVDQAKTIYDLLKQASPWAIPLVFFLFLPFIWTGLSKVLGVTTVPSKVILGASLVGIFLGIGALKYGEWRQENLRLRALELQQIFVNNDQISYSVQSLPNRFKKDDGNLANKIANNYPKQFISRTDELGITYIDYVDSMYLEKYQQKINPLLASYIDNKLLSQDTLDLIQLFQGGNHLQNLFLIRFVHGFLATPNYSTKYYLDVRSGIEYIVRKTSPQPPPPGQQRT